MKEKASKLHMDNYCTVFSCEKREDSGTTNFGQYADMNTL